MWVFEIGDNVTHAREACSDCLRMLRGSLGRDVAGQGRTPIDPVAHHPGLEKLSVVFLPVRPIADDFALLPYSRSRNWVMSATL
jgi:hypothetical protein